jgi:ribosomal protein S18 acetylase RimI-like enzyme
MDLELIKKLAYFNVYANLGIQFDRIDDFEKYSITYNNKIKDYWFNFIANIKANTKEEFDNIMLEAITKIKAKNRDIAVSVLPYSKEIYNNREMFFDNSYELVSNEVWQVYDNFQDVDKINTGCVLNVKLEKTEDMKLYSEEMLNAYQTGDENDPYGDLDSAYQEVYENYNKASNEYIDEFYFAKVDDKIVGITSCAYDNEIYGIYGLAIKKEFRCKGIGKEIIKQQLKMCKDKKLKLAFLQTEDGYYPADMYRKLGFKDICTKYYYIKKEI